jgi:DNA-binding response OmpR family regulator
MSTRARLLIAGQDAATSAFLADNLAADGYHVSVADGLDAALDTLARATFGAVIADLNGENLSLVDKVRGAQRLAAQLDPDVPLMLLTRSAGELERTRAYRRGCDDLIPKPFAYDELLARVGRLLARARGPRLRERLTVRGLVVDLAARTVALDGQPIELSQKEFELLRTLATEPRRVFTKQQLARAIWHADTLGTSRTLDSHACRLRHKLGRFGDRFVVNVWGVGYRLVDGPLHQTQLAARTAEGEAG